MRRTRIAIAVGAATCAATIAIAGCGAGAGNTTAAASGGQSLSGKTISFLVYTSPGTEFWSVLTRGAQDAAKQYGVSLNISYGDDDTVKYNNLIRTAVTDKVAGMAVSVPSDNGQTAAVCSAHDASIPVIAYNTNATAGPALNCEQAFIGQDFVQAGYLIGKRMISTYHLGSGDLVFTPVELPTATYAVQRFAGVKKALDEIGAHAEMVATTTDTAQAQTRMVQYLLGHSQTKAIITLGGVPLEVAEPAMKLAGVKLPVGGFDPSPQAIKGVQDGTINALVDQQPYSQGYYSVAQLVLEIEYGLYPSSMATGGNGLVDQSNVASIAKLTGTIR
jgi:simple sugar transport system substrate-binding protein